MPVYPGRRKGTWRVVVSIRNKPIERVVEGSWDDARMYEAKLLLDHNVGAASKNHGAPKFADFCRSKYQEHAKMHLRPSTQKTRRSHLTTLVEFFGRDRMTVIDTERVEEFKRWRLTGPNRVKPITLNTELRVLSAVRSWARDLGYPVAANCKIKHVKVADAGRVNVWTVPQVQALYRASRALAPDLVDVLAFLFDTGCRKGEAVAAEHSWLDFEARMVRIPVNEWWQPKNGRPREVPMSDSLYNLFKRRPREHERFLFVSTWSRPYTVFPDARFRDLRDAAGLTGGPHTTRHTYASHFLRKVPDLFLLAKVMGHSHAKVTELYSHLLPDHLAEARNAVVLASGEILGDDLGGKPIRRQKRRDFPQKQVIQPAKRISDSSGNSVSDPPSGAACATPIRHDHGATLAAYVLDEVVFYGDGAGHDVEPPRLVPATPIEVYTLDGTTFFGDGAEHEALDLPVPEPWTFYDVYAGCYGDPHPAGTSC